MIFSKTNPPSGSGCGPIALELTHASRLTPAACIPATMLRAPPEYTLIGVLAKGTPSVESTASDPSMAEVTATTSWPSSSASWVRSHPVGPLAPKTVSCMREPAFCASPAVPVVLPQTVRMGRASVVTRRWTGGWYLRGSALSGEQPEFAGPGGRFGAVGGAELLEDVGDVLLDRVERQVELVGDLLVLFTGG